MQFRNSFRHLAAAAILGAAVVAPAQAQMDHSKMGKDIVATAKVPLAVVNGIDEPFVNLDFVSKVTYANLWEGKTYEIANSGHAPFWDKPAEFDPYLKRFIADVSS